MTAGLFCALSRHAESDYAAGFARIDLSRACCESPTLAPKFLVYRMDIIWYRDHTQCHMVGEAARKLPVLFYQTRGGAEPVRNWLRSLDDRDQNTIGLDLTRVQFRWPVGMPLCRAMGDGLWEMRTNLPSNRPPGYCSA